MEMLLMAGCMSLFAFGVMALAFGAATRQEQPPAPAVHARRDSAVKLAPAHFFGSDMAVPPEIAAQVPLAALMLQLESHIRLEQAAAESFLETPTSALLHSRTMSPFVN